jgi:hypothetical protein
MLLACAAGALRAQVPPGPAETARYAGLHAAADDDETLRVLLSLGASAKLVTSRCDGTDRGDRGHRPGRRRQASSGHLARARGYAEMTRMLEGAGAPP